MGLTAIVLFLFLVSAELEGGYQSERSQWHSSHGSLHGEWRRKGDVYKMDDIIMTRAWQQ